MVDPATPDDQAHVGARGLPGNYPSADFTESASRPATARACSMSAASTITRTRGSVPDGRSSTRPVLPSSRSASETAVASSAELVTRDLSTSGTVYKRQVLERTPGLRDPRRQHQAGQRAVAGGGVVEDDDVAGLLAAEGVAVLLHLLQDVPVADAGLHELDALALHGQLEAQVGHDGRHDGVGTQRVPLPHRQRQHGEDLVAVHLRAGVVHGQAAVGVAVVGDAQVGAVLDDGGLEQVEVGGAAAVVDVEAVRHRADGDDLGPGPRERLGRDPVGRAVRLVEDDLQSVEAVGQDAHEMGDVLVEPLVVVADAADAGAGRAVPGGAGAVLGVDGLDAVLQLVGELVAAAGEELDAVVGHGVVAGGEHHAEVRAERAGEVGDRGRRQHTDAQHVHAGAGQARHHGGLQELPGGARVPADHRGRPVPGEGARLGQHVRRGDGETERQLGRQIRVGDAAHAVRAEESSHLSS